MDTRRIFRRKIRQSQQFSNGVAKQNGNGTRCLAPNSRDFGA